MSSSVLGLCGLQHLLRPKRDSVVPKCPSCQKEETKTFKELPARDKRIWIWHQEKGVFMCLKCTAQQKIEDKQRKQMADWYKKREQGRKAEGQSRLMRKLPSGKRWERTKSFLEAYRLPDHVRDQVHRAQSDPKNGGRGQVMERKDSLRPTASSSWAPDMTEQDVVKHPSERQNDLPIVLGFDCEPHSVEGVILEEGETDQPSPTDDSRHAGQNGTARSGGVDWNDLTAKGFVDLTVKEVELPIEDATQPS